MHLHEEWSLIIVLNYFKLVEKKCLIKNYSGVIG